MDKFCDHTGKRCFSSKKEARLGMHNLSARLRAYQCPFCQCWHLTKTTTDNILEENIPKPKYRKHKKRKQGRRILLSSDGEITYLE